MYAMYAMLITLTPRGAEIPKDPCVISKVKTDLVVRPFAPLDPWPKKYSVYVEFPDCFVVPVHWALNTYPDADIKDTRPAPDPAPRLIFQGVLQDGLRQGEAVGAVQQEWASQGGAMLCLGTGMGKTVTALYLACTLKLKTLVVVHKTFLKDQWRARAAHFIPHARITEVQGDVCDVSGDIVIAMVQTLASRKYVCPGFGLLIVDEAHHWAAPHISQSMFGLCTPYRLALTATPQRADKLDRVVSWFLGPVAFSAAREQGGKTRVRFVSYSSDGYRMPPPVNRRGDLDYTGVVSMLVEDTARTQMLIDQTASLVSEGHDVLVLSHRRGHCTDIAQGLVSRGIDAATYLGGDKNTPDARVLVATYSLTSEGFDCPRLSALVMATPGSNVEQACGRVMRGASRDAVIIDVVDQWGICFAQAAKRRALYRRHGFAYESKSPENVPENDPSSVAFAFVDEV